MPLNRKTFLLIPFLILCAYLTVAQNQKSGKIQLVLSYNHNLIIIDSTATGLRLEKWKDIGDSLKKPDLVLYHGKFDFDQCGDSFYTFKSGDWEFNYGELCHCDGYCQYVKLDYQRKQKFFNKNVVSATTLKGLNDIISQNDK